MQTECFFGWLKAAKQSNTPLLLDLASKKESQFSPLYYSGSYIATGISDRLDDVSPHNLCLVLQNLATRSRNLGFSYE